ncbi:MAG TPA: spore coat protein GerQ [Tenericutes bacterium]|jgi:spore germination protein Q|nr:spore coat protein GerQ [Mycoplasmatota bacterium]
MRKDDYMNENFYQNPVFPNQIQPLPQAQVEVPSSQIFPPAGEFPSLPMEQSFIENILRLNKGKLATVYMSFPDSDEWRSKVFTGIIEEAGRDHLIISDPKTGIWYLLRIIYLDYISFEERINYSPIFATPPNI